MNQKKKKKKKRSVYNFTIQKANINNISLSAENASKLSLLKQKINSSTILNSSTRHKEQDELEEEKYPIPKEQLLKLKDLDISHNEQAVKEQQVNQQKVQKDKLKESLKTDLLPLSKLVSSTTLNPNQSQYSPQKI